MASQTMPLQEFIAVQEECERFRAEIERLKIGQAVIAKQVGFYKPEKPDFEFVSVPLGILRRALRCDPPPYPEDGVCAQSIRREQR